MKHLLKLTQSTLLLTFTFLLFSVKPAHANLRNFVEALQAPEYNLESMVGGKSIAKDSSGKAQSGSGLITATAEALVISLIGHPDPNNSQAYYLEGSAVGSLADLTTSLYQQPISSKQYLAYLKNNLQNHSLVKPAYAETGGFKVLGSLLPLWIAIRNVSYIFFVIIFVIFGFMIMFRSKLNPQTVINIQLALPKIVVSLILVTFSYAILSFIVDLAFFSTALAQQILVPPLSTIDALSDNPTGWTWVTFDSSTGGVGFAQQIFKTFTDGTTVGEKIKNALGGLIKELGDLIFNGDINAILSLILAFTMISSLIKIFFALLTKHVTIILATITSPLAFLFGSFSKQGVGPTLKSFTSACLTFPAMVVILNLAFFFTKVEVKGLDNAIPPFVTSVASKNAAETDIGSTIGRIIGLGMLMIASKIPDVLDQALEVKGGAIGAAGQELAGGLKKIPIIGGLMS